MNFSETAPSTDVNLQQCFLLSVVVLMVYFDICSLIMFQSKKEKKRKNPLDWEQLMYYTTVCPLMARVSIKQGRKWKQ